MEGLVFDKPDAVGCGSPGEAGTVGEQAVAMRPAIHSIAMAQRRCLVEGKPNGDAGFHFAFKRSR